MTLAWGLYDKAIVMMLMQNYCNEDVDCIEHLDFLGNEIMKIEEMQK